MRLAITEWEGQLSPVFDVASRLIIVDVEQGREVHREAESLAGRTPEGRARRLAALHVDVLVCGAISSSVERAAKAAGVRVLSLVTGPVEDIVRIVSLGEPVPDVYLMPGCDRASPHAAPARPRRSGSAPTS
jgi:predicted Fe-Mo cluster-binding NifX family protein